MGRRGYSAYEVFFDHIGRGTIITVILAAVVSLAAVAFDGHRDQWAENSNQFKRLLFLTAIGQTQKSISDVAQEVEYDNSNAIKIGKFLREQRASGGRSLGQAIKEEKMIREAFDNIRGDEHGHKKERLKLVLTKENNIPWPLVLMAEDDRWHEIVDNPESLRILNKLLAEKPNKIPELKVADTDFPHFKFILYLIFFSQFLIFLFPLMDSEVPRLSRIPFKEPGLYVVVILLSPGAWPLMLIHPLFTGFCHKIKQDWHNRKKKKELSLDFLNMAQNSSDGDELLKRLQKRVGGANDSEI